MRICLHGLYLPALTPDSVPGQVFHASVVPSLLTGSIGMLTDHPSVTPPSQRAHLRPRLTLIRLTLIRKPESYGVPVSRRHSRYLCLHLLFHALHPASRRDFVAHGMLPYRMKKNKSPFIPSASVVCLMPDYYRCPVARPVSCYALFECVAASKPTSWLSKQLDLLSST